MPTRPLSQPASPHPSTPHHKPHESLLSRTIVAPILFLSFIVSLLIIDRRTSSSILLSPRGSPPGSPGPESSGGKDSHAYYHSHQRKLAKEQMDEAFAIRGRVIAGMCALAVLGFVVTVAVGLKVWGNVHG